MIKEKSCREVMLENKPGSDLIGPGNENEGHSKCLGRRPWRVFCKGAASSLCKENYGLYLQCNVII